MYTFLHENYESLSRHAAHMMHNQVIEKPSSVIVLAAGDSPRLAYTLFVQRLLAEGTDYSQCTFVALDEWLGIDASNRGSCSYFLRQNIVDPLKLRATQYRLFDGMTPDPEAACDAMNQFVAERGGVDLMVVGIGMNGHIGFNEPNTPANLYAHVATLDPDTTIVGQKYFDTQTALSGGITLGLRHFLEAGKAVVLANGMRKADIVRRALEQPPSIAVPASVVQGHPHGYVLVDAEAAAGLSQVKFSRWP